MVILVPMFDLFCFCGIPMFDLSGVELHLSYFIDNAEGPRL